MESTECVAVIGGGPAGSATAIQLARGGARVALIEREWKFKAGEILNHDIRFPLAELGIYDDTIRRFPCRVAGRVSSWGGERVVHDAMLDPLGGEIVVDRRDFEDFLLRAAERAGVTVIRDAKRLTSTVEADGVLLRWQSTTHARTLRAALLIEATGRGSGVMGAGRRITFDALIGLSVYPSLSDLIRFGSHLLIEPTASGWWYSAPLPNSSAVFSFLTDADLLPAGSCARAAFFREQMDAAPETTERFAAVRSHDGSPIVSLANTSARECVAGERWIAVGDATASFDPVAGIGVAAAMARGVALARLLLGSEQLTKAATSYVEAEREVFATYLSDHRVMYARETRWGDAMFWRRRATSRPSAGLFRIDRP